jgi:hypothetical protein
MPTKVVFCFPGHSFSKEFLECWSNAIVGLSRVGIQIQASFAYDPNLFYCRSKCLGCETRRGVDQKPFDGKVNYDFIFWIDSDVLFTTEDILRLIHHNEDVVSGCYVMHDNTHYPIVQTMDHEYFMQTGHYAFLTRPQLADLQAAGQLVPIDYVGFGFICIKKGVFESMKYPYFSPRRIDFDRPDVVEFASEDVSFCLNARDAGFKVLLDPTVVVAHQKLVPLR